MKTKPVKSSSKSVPTPAVADAPIKWVPQFAPLFEIDCSPLFLLILQPKPAVGALQIPDAYQRGEKIIRLAAAAPLLQTAVEAALNMVDGDGAPPRWDMLRAALNVSRSVNLARPTEQKPGTSSKENSDADR